MTTRVQQARERVAVVGRRDVGASQAPPEEDRTLALACNNRASARVIAEIHQVGLPERSVDGANIPRILEGALAGTRVS